MGSSAGKEPPSPAAEWTAAGQSVPDPRDPPDEEGRARDFDFEARDRTRQPRRQQQQQQRQQRQQRQQQQGGGEQGGQREFIRIGDRLDNQPMQKVKYGITDPDKEKFKPRIDKQRVRAVTDTKRLASHEEVDDTGRYIVISKPQLQADDADPYNKRPLPTFRRNVDVVNLDEEELQQRRREEQPLEEQAAAGSSSSGLNIDGMDLDGVSYQPRLDPLPLLLPRKATVPREEFLGTACGLDSLGVEDDGYARDLGNLPNGERSNLLTIISQF